MKIAQVYESSVLSHLAATIDREATQGLNRREDMVNDGTLALTKIATTRQKHCRRRIIPASSHGREQATQWTKNCPFGPRSFLCSELA